MSNQHHEELIKGITEEMKPILSKSDQAVFLYLDDEHKVCNKKYADLVGYKSAREWADAEAPLSDVVEADQAGVIDAYMNASQKMVAGTLDVKLKNVKTGKVVKTRLVVAPVGHAGHVFTANFFTKI
jgi:hypothetical protein